MARYIFKRLLIMIPTFLGITILVYVVASMAPGTPLDMLLANGPVSQETLELLKEKYGLNQPVIVQYLQWLRNLLQGNLGMSYRTSEPVLQMVLNRLGPTLLISIPSIIISVLIAVPMGIFAAMKPNSLVDHVCSGLSFLTVSVPNFFAGLILVYLFAVKLSVLPASGMFTNSNYRTTGNLLLHMILPVTVLVFQQLGDLLRQARGSMIEVMSDDFIRTAKAKGLNKRQTVLRHALRNSLTPVLTTLGMSLPFIVGGAIVTEQIFSWPGLGSLMVLSINARDYPCIMGITVFIAVVVLVGNLLIDLLYSIIDPRIRYQ